MEDEEDCDDVDAFTFGDLIEGKTDWLGVILLLFLPKCISQDYMV